MWATSKWEAKSVDDYRGLVCDGVHIRVAVLSGGGAMNFQQNAMCQQNQFDAYRNGLSNLPQQPSWPSHVTHSWSMGMAEQIVLPRLLEVLERIAAALEAANFKPPTEP